MNICPEILKKTPGLKLKLPRGSLPLISHLLKSNVSLPPSRFLIKIQLMTLVQSRKTHFQHLLAIPCKTGANQKHPFFLENTALKTLAIYYPSKKPDWLKDDEAYQSTNSGDLF